MTVREIIAILQKLKKDKKVLARCFLGNGYGEASVVEIGDRVHIFSEEIGEGAEMVTLNWSEVVNSNDNAVNSKDKAANSKDKEASK